MTIQEMQDKVIQTLGHENAWTIWFFSICEKLTTEEIERAYLAMMTTAWLMED
jgi:hypothetical protein